MSTRYYGIRFAVRCGHGFFRSNRAEDLEVVPTAECAGLLRRHRIMVKGAGAGAAIAIDERRDFGTPAVPDVRPVLPVPDGTVFRFALKLRDARFFTVTDVDQQTLKSGRVFVFSSEGIAVQVVGGEHLVRVHAGALPAPVVTLPDRFVHPVDPLPEPMYVELRDRGGAVVLNRVLPPRDGPPKPGDEPISTFVDASGLADGLYTVRDLDKDGAVLTSTPAFISHGRIERGVIAVVEVHYSAAVMDLDPPPVFTVDFPVRAIRWVYDVAIRPVTDPALIPTAIDARRIALAGTPVAFTRDPDPIPPPPAPAPARLTFTSNAPIPLRQEPRAGIQLLHNAPTGTPPPADPTVLITNLPNPRTGRLELAAGQLQSRIHLTVN